MRDELDSLQDQQRALIKLLQQKDNSLAKHVKYEDGRSTQVGERKEAAIMRLERLGQRMADAGYLESEEIMLDERHLALSRCLGHVNRMMCLYLGRWRAKAAAISANRRH